MIVIGSDSDSEATLFKVKPKQVHLNATKADSVSL